jgi:3-methyladenine DNA glycosylase AlkD
VLAHLRAVTLLTDVRKVLKASGDPTKAAAMQAYMKSPMPFWGVPTPDRVKVKAVLDAHEVSDAKQWRTDVLALWRGATHREERYAALTLTKDRRAKTFQTIEALPMYEEMITTGAWWDYVDEIAGDRFAALLRAEPSSMRRAMAKWSTDADMWKRRSSIICQLRFKTDLDLDLLYTCIEPSLEGPKGHPLSKQFFIRKAIGWALRQHAKTDPDEVRRYVKKHEAQLSGLSRREALKHL